MKIWPSSLVVFVNVIYITKPMYYLKHNLSLDLTTSKQGVSHNCGKLINVAHSGTCHSGVCNDLIIIFIM